MNVKDRCLFNRSTIYSVGQDNLGFRCLSMWLNRNINYQYSFFFLPVSPEAQGVLGHKKHFTIQKPKSIYKKKKNENNPSLRLGNNGKLTV